MPVQPTPLGPNTLANVLGRIDRLERKVKQMQGARRTTLDRGDTAEVAEPIEGQTLVKVSDNGITWYADGAWRTGGVTETPIYAASYVSGTQAVTLDSSLLTFEDFSESSDPNTLGTVDSSLGTNDVVVIQAPGRYLVFYRVLLEQTSGGDPSDPADIEWMAYGLIAGAPVGITEGTKFAIFDGTYLDAVFPAGRTVADTEINFFLHASGGTSNAYDATCYVGLYRFGDMP